MRKLIASEDFKPGEHLAVADLAFIDADGEPCHFAERAKPNLKMSPFIGLAARTIAEGQFFDYDPEGNTADVITRGTFTRTTTSAADVVVIGSAKSNPWYGKAQIVVAPHPLKIEPTEPC